MEAVNPYQTPTGELSASSDAPAPVKIFSPQGRIGRLRYLAYTTGMNLLVMPLMLVLMFAMMPSQDGSGGGSFSMFGTLLYIALMIVSMVFGVFWMIKRFHDLNQTGWWSLLMLVPLVNLIAVLYIIFAPGSQGGNDFGAPPPENPTGVKILAFLFPAIFVIGIVAAVVIPTLNMHS